jgi:hypothetical protein
MNPIMVQYELTIGKQHLSLRCLMSLLDMHC